MTGLALTAAAVAALLPCEDGPAGPVAVIQPSVMEAPAVAPAMAPEPNGASATAPLPDDELRALYERGTPYDAFLGNATRRTELWHGNTRKAAGIDATLVARAAAVGGTWRFLAVAVDSCSDSVSTIPYLAELVSRVDGLELRIVDSTVGRGIMETHPTPDGRPATPTVLLLDASFEEAGCFIERPPTLQTMMLDEWAGRARDTAVEDKMAWYAEDAGQETLETFVTMLEEAAAGRTLCG